MQSYFELFGLPEQYNIDEDELKKAYYKLSRSYHPDYFTLAPQEEKDKAAIMAELINDAYKTLSIKELRIKYILTTNGLMVDGDKSDIDKDFLMEMMEINEAIFELQTMDESEYAEAKEQVMLSIDNFEAELNTLGNKAMNAFDQNHDKATSLESIKEYYLKHRYLLRMKDHLEGQTGVM